MVWLYVPGYNYPNSWNGVYLALSCIYNYKLNIHVSSVCVGVCVCVCVCGCVCVCVGLTSVMIILWFILSNTFTVMA